MNKSFWSNKNVLITGHTGFKGSWLCLLLSYFGAKVYGLSLDRAVSRPDMFSLIGNDCVIFDDRGDIADLEICKSVINKANPSIIFHMAAQSLVRKSYLNPLKTYNTNVMGTANILEAAKTFSQIKAVVIVTTDKCYENIEKEYAYIESDHLGGYDPYSSSKACAEHVASAYYRSFFNQNEVGIATARAGNVIGGGDWSQDRLIPDAMRAWSESGTLSIRYPLSTRPWQHVLEPLNGYITLAEKLWNNPKEFSGPWNFGPDNNSIKTVQDTVELAAKEWGRPANIKLTKSDNPHEANLLQLNSDKARSMLGWKPYMDFNMGVIETIRWYKEFYSSNTDMKMYTLDQVKNYEGMINAK